MFRALTCPSSGGQIVLLQRLVSSLSANICTERRLRVDSALNRRTLQTFAESDEFRRFNNTICPPEDEHGIARNISRIIM